MELRQRCAADVDHKSLISLVHAKASKHVVSVPILNPNEQFAKQ